MAEKNALSPEQVEEVERYRIQAQTIINQMGGKVAQRFAGMHSFVLMPATKTSSGGVKFKFKGSGIANTCIVMLDWSDTYVMEFWKITPKKTRLIKEVPGVYCDMLADIFEDTTEVYLHF